MINSYLKIIDNYTSYDNLICQADRDQGDTAQREGLVSCLLSFHYPALAQLRLSNSLDKLRKNQGVYVRTSDLTHWGSNPNNLSRDQRAMLELGMAMTNNKQELSQAKSYIIKRFGFHQNTHPGTDANPKAWKIPDIVSPGELAVYIRGLDDNHLKFLLPILDLGLILDIKFRKKWDGANMSAINIMYANTKWPTLISKLASKLCPWEEYKVEIKNYYTNDNGIPPLGAMYEIAINKYLARK